MKKCLFSFLWLVVLFVPLNLCAQQSVPYTENFDSYTDNSGRHLYISGDNTAPSWYGDASEMAPYMPSGWIFNGINRSSRNAIPAAFLTTYSNYVMSGKGLFIKSSTTKAMIISLPVFSESLSNLVLKFNHKESSTSGAKIIIGYGLALMETDFTQLSEVTRSSSFAEAVCDLSQYSFYLTNAQYCIKLKITTDGYSSTNIGIDNVSVTKKSGNTPGTESQATIGGGSENGPLTPMYTRGNKTYGASWCIYTRAELMTAGITSAQSITKLAYNYCGWGNQGNGPNFTPSFKIYMATTSKSSFSSDYDTISRASMTLVYDGSTTFTYGSWTDITLTQPFAYNPASGQNLVILVERPNTSISYDYRFLYSEVSNSAIYKYFSGTSEMCTRTSKRANIRLTTSSAPAPPVQQYTITAAVNDNSMGSVTGGGTYNEGATALLTATANAGYHFVDWNDGVTTASRNVTVTTNATYTANFAANPTRTVTVVSADESMGVVSGSGSYLEGTQQTISATPNNGYRFVCWNDGDINARRTITIPDSDVTYTATFAIERFDVTVSVNNDLFGYVTMDGTNPFDANSQVVLTATANPGYQFASWSDGNTSNPRTITVTSNVSLQANFTPISGPQSESYTLTLSSNGMIMGQLFGAGTYQAGTAVWIYAFANAGFVFSQWSDGNTENPRQIIINQDTSFMAQFANATPSSANTFVIVALANDNSRGSVQGSGTYAENDPVVLTPIANEGYRFFNWSDGSTEQVRRFFATENVALVANFVSSAVDPTVYTVSVVSMSDTMGRVSGILDGTARYVEGTEVTITATADSGYRFVRWSNGVTSNPYTFTVTSNISLVAIFATQPANPTTTKYTIYALANVATMGTVTGSGQYLYGSQVSLSATPNSGYQFVNWSDGDTHAVRTITVTDHATYYANFARTGSVTYYTLTVTSSNDYYGLAYGSGVFPENAYATLYAVTCNGGVFTRWSSTNTNENPLQYRVTGNMNIQAEFSAPETPTPPTVVDSFSVILSVNNPSMGSVFGSGRYARNTVITIRALANAGYHFVRWSDGSTIAEREIVVDQNRQYMAIFERNVGIDDIVAEQYDIHVKDKDIVVRGAESSKVRIFDMVGRLVCNGICTEESHFTMPHTGVYMVQVGRSKAHRVVVMK
ncbi:MAG: hypothetical protein KBT04_05950 [Bacteroidales bacterium]|nr:hypothetical protein [Candidatus Colimorpha onthohippi]